MEPVDWRTSYRPFLMQEQVQSPCARSLCASDYDPIIEVEETSITDTAVFKIGMTILGAAAYYCASELLLESMIQSVVLLTSGTWGAYWALRSINHFVPEVGIMLYLVAERVYRAIEFIIIKSAQACWLSLTYTAMSVAYVANVIDETANAISSHCDRALNAAISYSYPIISDAVEYIYTKVAACASWVVGALEDAFEWIVWNCSNQRSSWAETIKNELSAFAAVQVLSDLYCSNDEWMRLKPARQQEVFHYMNATYGDEQADIRSFSQKAFPVLQSMHRIKRAMVDHDTSFDVALIDLCMGRDDLFTMAFEAIQLHYSSGEAFQAFKQFYEKFKMVENAIATNDPLTCIDNIWGFSEPVAKALFGRACMRIAAAPAPETGYETSWIKPMADAILPRMIVRDELELAIRKKSTPEAVLITHAATTKKEDWIDFLDSIQRRITFENSRAAHTETERVRNWMRGVDSLKVALKNKKVADCRKHLEKANHFATAFLEKAYPELTYEELLLVSVIAYQTLQKAMN
ncbi:MAG TPA: hypothetical protein VN457_05350, partial [Chlamydiales bacterium]|nr:hypothetical protein [Chlamydiales bacterium]